MGLERTNRPLNAWLQSIDYSFAGSSIRSCARCGIWIAYGMLAGGAPHEARTE